jgi:hypothetical protein
MSPDWATKGAPDTASIIAATRVQMLVLDAQYYTDFVDYLMEAYGETRERAEEIVRNCQSRED